MVHPTTTLAVLGQRSVGRTRVDAFHPIAVVARHALFRLGRNPRTRQRLVLAHGGVVLPSPPDRSRRFPQFVATVTAHRLGASAQTGGRGCAGGWRQKRWSRYQLVRRR